MNSRVSKTINIISPIISVHEMKFVNYFIVEILEIICI